MLANRYLARILAVCFVWWVFFACPAWSQEPDTVAPAGSYGTPTPPYAPGWGAGSGGPYSTGPYSTLGDGPVFSSPPTVPPSQRVVHAEPLPLVISPAESSWYARIDYFHWNERYQGADFVNESGLLYTLGYARRSGIQRFRLEGFAGRADYDGLGSGTGNTGYAGIRGEYDLLFEPDWSPRLTWFAGLGTRLWMRSIPDGIASNGGPVVGYNENWWTLYPYLGVETRRNPDIRFEWFASGRVGLTAYTFQYESYDDTVLHPQPGVTGQLESGFRGKHFTVSTYLEAMTWAESDAVLRWGYDSYTGQYYRYPILQPTSVMLTAGVKAGFSF